MSERLLTLDGLPVYDADEPLVIEVIKGDIKPISKKNPEACALAQACKRELDVPEARVYLSRLYIRQPDHWIRYMLSETARSEVKSFDKYGDFTTGSYRLSPRTERDRTQNYNKSSNKSSSNRAVRDIKGVRHMSPLHGGAYEYPKRTK